jgi:WD40 repeat protein
MAAGPSRRHLLIALGVLLVAVLLSLVLHSSNGDGAKIKNVAEGTLAIAPRYLDERPGVAARLALAGDRLKPSVAAELSMLSVAIDSAGVERVIDGGSAEVTAAIRASSLLITADEQGVVRVWRPHTGLLLGRTRVPDPVVVMADTEAARLLVAADKHGRLSLIDLSNPTEPSVSRLPGKGDGEPPLALAFANHGVEIVTLSRQGVVEQLDTMTGRVLSRWSLREVEGAVPWRRTPGSLKLAAASFDSQGYGDYGRLLVGLPDGAAVRIELKSRRGRTMVPAGFAPGRITALAESPYGHEVAIAATGGYLSSESGEARPVVRRGLEATGVTFDPDDYTLWVANREGVSSLNEGVELPFAGRPVTALTTGRGGVVGIDLEGAVSVLGEAAAGLALPEVAASTFAAFAPNGRLLIEEGSPGYVYRLVALRAGHGLEYGQVTSNPERQSYEPDPDWWPEEDGFSVEAGAIDDEFAVVGGQDPTGTAVVLVWDASSGRPLRRLPLSTGSVETLEPSVVTEVLLLPEKHLLAAYSAVQQLIAIWSTDSWEQVASVPVGSIGSMALSPDESKIVAIGGSAEEPEGEGGTELVFVDVDSGAVAGRVSREGITDAAWSPDEERLAVVGTDGKLRILSADGENELRSPIQLEDAPLALAWRPDGEEIAVAMFDSLVLADPLSGVVSPPFPTDGSDSIVHHLDWSRDGRFLAAAAWQWSEDGEGYEPDSTQIWTVGGPRLQRRMCQLAGGATSQEEWDELVGTAEPKALCRAPALSRPFPLGEGVDRLDAVDLVFRSGNDLFAADLEGHAAEIGRTEDDIFPGVSLGWGDETVAWATQGEVGMMGLGARQAEEWTCLCNGAALHDGELIALGSDGRQLFEFSPGRDSPRTIALHGRPGLEPRLMGFLGDEAVVAGYATPPERPTPSTVYLIDAKAHVTKLATDRHGAAHPPFAQSADGDVVAFTSTISGGACYSPSAVGIVSRNAAGRPEVTYPTIDDDDPQVVRSLFVRPNGTVEAALAPIGCDEEGTAPTDAADATRYVLRGNNWSPTPDQSFDVQRSGPALATISTPKRYQEDGNLTVESGEERTIAGEVEQVWMRP